MLVNASKFRVAVIATAALTIGACSKKDNSAMDTTAASSTMTPADTAAAPSAEVALSDANIVALLDEANMADSAAGSIAATKGTSSAVRDFAKMMMRDHHTLRAQCQALAKKLNVTPEPPAGDNSVSNSQKNLDMLNSTAKGKDFDKGYIDAEVDYHKAVLETATKAMSAAQNTELKDLIQKAAPLLQAHLDKAQSIQRNLQ